jgi:AraC-like DNA-binding protein
MRTPTSAVRPPPESPLVSIHYARLVAREIGAKEKELGPLLAGTGVRPAQFLEEETLLTTAQTEQIALNAMALSQDASLGLRVGKLLAPETYGPLGFLVSASPNLKVAIEDFKQLLPTRIPFVDLQTGYNARGLTCHLGMRYTDNLDFYRGAIDCIAVSLTAIVTAVTRADLSGMQLRCGFAAPTYRARYGEFLPFAVEFEAQGSHLFIPAALLFSPNPIASRANYQLALQQCLSMRQALAVAAASTTNRVKEVLLSGPPGTLSEVHVAQSLFISRRTLARRLTAEHTTFQHIKDQILADIAATHLRETDATIESLAALLNYHDASNFRRAFKRWFDCTPEAFRQRSH